MPVNNFNKHILISGAYANIGISEICPTDVVMEVCLCVTVVS